jgi:hypothetical protein
VLARRTARRPVRSEYVDPSSETLPVPAARTKVRLQQGSALLLDTPSCWRTRSLGLALCAITHFGRSRSSDGSLAIPRGRRDSVRAHLDRGPTFSGFLPHWHTASAPSAGASGVVEESGSAIGNADQRLLNPPGKGVYLGSHKVVERAH